MSLANDVCVADVLLDVDAVVVVDGADAVVVAEGLDDLVEDFGDPPDGLLDELPQPATSIAAASRAARVPTLIVCAFPGLGVKWRSNPTFFGGSVGFFSDRCRFAQIGAQRTLNRIPSVGPSSCR